MTTARPDSLIQQLWGEEFTSLLKPHLAQVEEAHAAVVARSFLELEPLAEEDLQRTAVNLLLRSQLRSLGEAIERLFGRLLQLAEKHRQTPLEEAASTVGYWCAAQAEELIDCVELLAAVMRLSNQNPLGAGNGFGYSSPYNRELPTRQLAFRTLYYNTLAAANSHNRTLRAALHAKQDLKECLNPLMAQLPKEPYHLDCLTLPHLIAQLDSLTALLPELRLLRQDGSPYRLAPDLALPQLKLKMSTALEPLLFC